MSTGGYLIAAAILFVLVVVMVLALASAAGRRRPHPPLAERPDLDSASWHPCPVHPDAGDVPWVPVVDEAARTTTMTRLCGLCWVGLE